MICGENLFKEHDQFAGTDDQRLEDFQRMINDPKIKAVICARGGYGTVRIVDRIDFSTFKKNPTWIAGFSDVTVLHSHIHTNFGIETIHSAMPVNFKDIPDDSQTIISLKNALFGEGLSYEIASNDFNRKGIAEGMLTGGNLSIIYSLTGSVSDIDTKGKILFLEDLGEPPYRLDRMLTQLQLSGKLQSLAGIILGSFQECDPPEGGYSARDVLKEMLQGLDIPILANFPAGHIAENWPFPLGSRVRIDSAARSVEILDPAVS